MTPTQAQLQRRFTYEPVTGFFYYREATIRRQVGQRAGSKAGPLRRRYWQVGVNKVSWPLHRLAFIYMLGYLPKVIDHKNGNSLDNRWKNLRETDALGNAQNARKRKDNKSGYKGVYWHSQSGTWRAKIQANGKMRTLGNHKTPELAYEAYKKAAKELHGEFANFGSVA